VTNGELADFARCAPQAAGGLISAALLAQPGASKYYMGGLTVSLSFELRIGVIFTWKCDKNKSCWIEI